MIYVTEPNIDDICSLGKIVSIKSCKNCKYCKELTNIVYTKNRNKGYKGIKVNCIYENN